MKSFLILAFFALASASVEIRNGRRYDPSEEKGTDKKWMVIVDEDGKLNLENLQRENKDIVTVEKTDVKLYLYTYENRNGEFLSPANFEDLVNSQVYNPANPNLFISHGWHGSVTSGLNRDIRNALFNKGIHINVFVVDWNSFSQHFYTIAIAAVPPVGDIVGDYINQMIDHFGLTPDDFHLVGHSLGGQVVGCIGAAVNGLVSQIVALDPARPGFSLEDVHRRVDVTDGRTVHVIHTNAGFQGFSSSVGHADFYPNGGSKQAGCWPDLSGSCSHGRATDFYIESISSTNFRATRCESYEEYTVGSCAGNEVVVMGQWPIDPSQSGDYYLDTAESSPFALG